MLLSPASLKQDKKATTSRRKQLLDTFDTLQTHFESTLQEALKSTALPTAPHTEKALNDYRETLEQQIEHLQDELRSGLKEAIESYEAEEREEQHLTEGKKDEGFFSEEADEYYIENAGLVIVWPFLSRFFAALGLLDKGAFVNEATRQKAVHLLQYLVQPDEKAYEHLLPLNKLLCGMDVSLPLALEQEITEKEKQEAEALLEAVLSNWGILKSSSVEGLREAFLLRNGKLIKQQEGQYLLQVEQKSYDMIMTKIAWGLQHNKSALDGCNTLCRMDLLISTQNGTAMSETERLKNNALDMARELEWFTEVLKTRSALNAREESTYTDVYEVVPPYFNGSPSDYAAFINKYDLGFDERIYLMLALAPHIKPELLDIFLPQTNLSSDAPTEFGGRKGQYHRGFLPTGETLLFILAGYDLERKFSLMHYLFNSEHLFVKNNILWLAPVENGEPPLSGALSLSKEILDLLTKGTLRKPDFNAEFPAKLLTSNMDWDDLVLPPNTRHALREIETWVLHHHTLMEAWGMSRKIKPGYRTLFYGPPGTGKSLTTTLLGKKTGRDVYRIDLSKVISKYIGETEKNLGKIFDRAENKDWILFFDEADALFGKRTKIEDANDRNANQEVAYLLQRIEDHNGLVILASNLKDNLDEAFTRRFQSFIHFPMPRPEERYQLWKNGFPKTAVLEKKIDLHHIAETYELAGGLIINAIQFSALMAIQRGSNEIKLADLMEGIKKEYQKAGKTL